MSGFLFRPFDVETRRNPYPIFAEARRDHPVHLHAEAPIYSLFRYADIHSILRDPATWSNVFPPPPGVDPSRLPPRSMLGQDPPVHTRLRGLVNQAFTPRIIRRLETRMREIADELLARDRSIGARPSGAQRRRARVVAASVTAVAQAEWDVWVAEGISKNPSERIRQAIDELVAGLEALDRPGGLRTGGRHGGR